MFGDFASIEALLMRQELAKLASLSERNCLLQWKILR